MTYQHTSQIDIQTDPTALKSVLAWFDQFQTSPIPHNIWLQCQLALIEGFTNAVRHAHAELPQSTPIRIEVSVSDRAIEIKIWDRGPGFDLASVLRHKITANDPNSEGGRGLKIMYLVADRLTYEPDPDQGNCLHLHKVFDI
ncbi:ATP-binding protein [Nodosilinea sp. LEGE 07088]|uniref:ATP-binding protein n=1 Tax=Nodosilinea sp. LEGE 07088 TaxID=2777968 RepID=UPI00188260B6|nr:ATP-binding protein [Nodosilinea sp. LEGE 07088]MBE9137401.1 ATP-binding protein [Nodosilinea sp. LEGE 07088]